MGCSWIRRLARPKNNINVLPQRPIQGYLLKYHAWHPSRSHILHLAILQYSQQSSGFICLQHSRTHKVLLHIITCFAFSSSRVTIVFSRSGGISSSPLSIWHQLGRYMKNFHVVTKTSTVVQIKLKAEYRYSHNFIVP